MSRLLRRRQSADQAKVVQPSPDRETPVGARSPSIPALLQLQRTYGNRYVQRLVARALIQPKLKVGPANDKYEQEADQIAAQVMRRPENPSPLAEETITPVQRQSGSGDGAGFQVAPEVEQLIAHHSAGGQPLPEMVRRTVEPRFGADFSGVRVHADAAADQLNQTLQAQAFTTGPNIFFRRGAYAPGAQSGQQLLAHELTHVIQQTGADSTPPAPRLKSGIKGQRKRVVQRVIKVNGQDQDDEAMKALLSQWEEDKPERTILANWHASKTVHDFVAKDKHKNKDDAKAKAALKEAVEDAKTKAKEPPTLYKAANLKFLTQAEGRLPTLYFKSGNQSGRIRQQHGSGPAVKAETNKVDYFFAEKGDMNKFEKAAQKAWKQDKVAFNPTPEEREGYGASLIPTEDYYHYEVTYTNDTDHMIKKVHPSGGQIVTDLSGYLNDETIKKIYQRAIGYTT